MTKEQSPADQSHPFSESFVDTDTRKLLDSLEDAVFVHDFEGRIHHVNAAGCKRLDYTKEELLIYGLPAIDSPEFAAQMPERMSALIQSGKALFESVHLRKDGTGIPVEVNARLIEFKGRTMVVGVARDITERKLAKERLAEIEEKFRIAFELSVLGMALTDLKGNFLQVNESLCKIFGYSKEELLKLRFMHLTHPEDLAITGNAVAELHTGKLSQIQFQKRYIHKAGHTLWAELNISIKREFKDAPAYFVTQVQDITSRKAFELQLRKSEESYKLLFNSGSDGVFVQELPAEHTRFGKFIQVNDIACEKLGYSREELLQLGPSDIEDPDYNSSFVEHLTTLLQKKRTSREGRYLTKTRKSVPVEIRDHLFTMDGKELILSNVRDISERKEAEKERAKIQAQLLHSSKLASIGTLAAGVAHEINNPLAILRGYNDFVREALTRSDTAQVCSILEKQEQAIGRIAGIVNSLRLYAREDSNLIEKIDLHKIIRETLSLVVSIYKKADIHIETKFNSNQPITAGNMGQVQQVLLNLLVNAKDALEKRETDGLIEITTEDAKNTIILKVADNGCGMTRSQIRQVFNAFYTTKPPGKGTGLGLAISHSIVTAMQGTIDIDSEPGIGTTFTITLPRYTEDTPLPSGEIQYRGSALVVDEIETDRMLLRLCLEDLGYRVHEASDGLNALELLKQRHYAYLIVNIKTAGESGSDLIAQAIPYTKRGTQVIAITDSLLTCYTPQQHELLKKLSDACLTKPFRRAEIQALLESLKYLTDQTE